MKDYTKQIDEVLASHYMDEGDHEQATIVCSDCKAKLSDLLRRVEKEAQMGMLEYFDQVPSNDVMDWKGLFADTRKLLEAEL